MRLKFWVNLAVVMLGKGVVAMTQNTLIPLPGFTLPRNFPWQVQFVSAVESQLRRLSAVGRFLPPRFFGYYFLEDEPVAVTGRWTVTLDETPPIRALPQEVEKATFGQYGITSVNRAEAPEYLLIHDRRDGACWLWRFAFGLRFVESVEPIFNEIRTSKSDDDTPPAP